MADGGPHVPTAAARLVIVLLPAGSDQPADAIRRDAPVIVALPQPGIPSGPGEATVADPEFATCYQAEMPALISFLVRSGAEPDDAPETAQDAFRQLFEQWTTVDEPKLWLRKVAFPAFLRRPVCNTASRGGNHDEPGSADGSSRFNFGEEERLFIALTRLLPTAQRAVLSLHMERFRVHDIARILGMKPDAVRKNLKEARASLMNSLNLNDNTWTGQTPPAQRPPRTNRRRRGPSAGGGAAT